MSLKTCVKCHLLNFHYVIYMIGLCLIEDIFFSVFYLCAVHVL